MTDSDQIALDAAHKIEALPRDLHKAQKTARIQLIVLDALAAQPASPLRGITTAAEIQSGMDRQKWAENLILQLPIKHDGRNSWLLNYGRGEFAQTLRKGREFLFNEQSQAINPPTSPPEQPAADPVGQSIDEAAADNFGLTIDDLDEGDDE